MKEIELPFREIQNENFVIKIYEYGKEKNNSKVEFYLQNINSKDTFFYCVDIFLFILYPNNFLKKYLQKLIINEVQKYKDIAKTQGKRFIFLIDAIEEAPSYQDDLAWFFDKLYQKNIILKEEILIISGAHYQTDSINHVWAADVSIIKDFSHIEIEKDVSNLPDYHFISLARLPRPHRITATIEILERHLNKFGNCSLGSGHYFDKEESDNLLAEYCPEKYKNIFPLYIDGEVLGNQQYDISHPYIKNAFVNVVMESSFEKFSYQNKRFWHLPFMTEKTMKTFMLGQVPIFITCSKSLEKIRDLGFDLFDDIIDHSYDLETDLDLKIKKAIDQLEKICAWSIEDCRKFKQNNMNRFEKNFQNYVYIKNNYKQMTLDNLQKTLDTYSR